MAWVESSALLASGRTRVRLRGEGPLLLWTHGLFLPCDVEDRTPIPGLLEALRGWRVARYDARGHGHSDAARSDADQRWDRLGRDVLDLARALSAERFVAAGASMGAAASLHAALQAPERVSGLVLVIPPTAWETRAAQAEAYRAMEQLLEERGSAELARAAELALAAQPITPGLEAVQAALIENLRAWKPEALARVLRGSAASDLPDEAALETLRMPCLIVAVRDDAGHPLGTAERLAECLREARLVVLDRLDDPTPAREALRAFLRSGEAPGSD